MLQVVTRFFEKETQIIAVKVIIGRSEMTLNWYDVRKSTYTKYNMCKKINKMIMWVQIFHNCTFAFALNASLKTIVFRQQYVWLKSETSREDRKITGESTA